MGYFLQGMKEKIQQPLLTADKIKMQIYDEMFLYLHLLSPLLKFWKNRFNFA